MPTSVVTGGAGFLGSHLCDYLLAEDHRVICVDNLETGSLENIEHLRDKRFTFVHQDVVEGIWIDEPVDSLARRQLAARTMPLGGLLASAARDFGRALPQFGDQGLHLFAPPRELLRLALDL